MSKINDKILKELREARYEIGHAAEDGWRNWAGFLSPLVAWILNKEGYGVLELGQGKYLISWDNEWKNGVREELLL